MLNWTKENDLKDLVLVVSHCNSPPEKLQLPPELGVYWEIEMGAVQGFSRCLGRSSLRFLGLGHRAK